MCVFGSFDWKDTEVVYFYLFLFGWLGIGISPVKCTETYRRTRTHSLISGISTKASNTLLLKSCRMYVCKNRVCLMIFG